jgi:plasmid stability protein
MATLQVKNVPEHIHRKIRLLAKRQGRTIGEILLTAARKELEREQFHTRLAKRESIQLDRPAARSLEEARAERSYGSER